ncbi:hypothetical protein ACFV2U_53950 [Streptomyces sp. NPDC059697]
MQEQLDVAEQDVDVTSGESRMDRFFSLLLALQSRETTNAESKD